MRVIIGISRVHSFGSEQLHRLRCILAVWHEIHASSCAPGLRSRKPTSCQHGRVFVLKSYSALCRDIFTMRNSRTGLAPSYKRLMSCTRCSALRRR